MKLKIILPLIIFVFLMVLLSKGLNHDPKKLPSVLINQKVPTFSLALLHDPKATFSNKDLLGHVSLLNVWATWCSECRREFPMLLKLSKQIQIYGLNYKDNKTAAINWLKEQGNPYRKIGFDADGLVAIDFGVYGTPETYLIDKKGIIRYRYVGPITESTWQKQFLPRIKQLEQE